MTKQESIFDGPRDSDTLGGRLSRAREAAGIDPGDFSKMLGVRKQTLMAWESDRAEPRANKLFAMAGLVGVSPSWLLYGMGEAPRETGVSAQLRQARAEFEKVRLLRQRADTAMDQMQAKLMRIMGTPAEG